MEKKIKTLSILSIIAILAFLGMQVYWLFGRYEYSLREYEDDAFVTIANKLDEYMSKRSQISKNGGLRVSRSTYKLNTDYDSIGNRVRTATISTQIFDGRSLLGIREDRKLTSEEQRRLSEFVTDSVASVEERKASIDVTSAPSDGASWNAMSNYEREIKYPFDINEIDSLLRKGNIEAKISLIISDSIIWEPLTIRHKSTQNPHLKFIASYSELERKAVVIDAKIPIADVIKNMGWTLIMALVLSLLLILCLIWQIKTITRLTRLDKMRNSFITTMIHELKRPISTLKMSVAGIESDRLMKDDQWRHELTHETRIALDNLSAYFSKLRDITFNNVEQIPLNVSQFNLYELVDGVARSMIIPSEKKVTFENDVPENFEVTADRSHFVNILTNLMENAIKYSGNEVTVKIRAEITPDGCRIAIADNGNGISVTDRDKIFNRFYRGNTSSTDIPGMGLGLAYVKLLVEAHGGTISVESKEGDGSSFIITLTQ